MKLRLPGLSLGFLVLLLLHAKAEGPPPTLPLETFFSDNEMQSVQVSPDARFLTFLAPRNGRANLAIMDRETKKLRWITNMKEESVVAYVWAKKDRLLFAQQFGGREQYGMFACDPDAGNLIVINQLQRVEATADGAGQEDAPSGERDLPKTLISLLPKDPDHILMNRLRGNSGLGDIVKVNIRNGRETVVERNYINARAWIADSTGAVRIAITTDLEEPVRIKYRKDEKSDWRTIGEFSKETSLFFEEASPVEPHWRPSVFAKDDRTLYVKSFLEHDKAAIRTLDPETGAWGPVLFTHPRVEPGDRLANYRRGGLSSRAAVDGLLFSPTGDLAGVSYHDERPGVEWIDPRMAKMTRDLNAALPATVNQIVSMSRDGKAMVILAASDRDPGTFYLYEPEQQRMEEVGRIRPAVKPAQMAEVRPIRFQARDGWEIPGYLTLPAGREPKNLPLVVVPHGGPYGPRDQWGFYDQGQFLANRGYAVLQVNFRGSGGYGLKFQLGGYRGYGLQMQDDITDGVKWCIEQGYANPARIGIFGASYGGYVVMRGLTSTPELYACGINYVGVADTEMRAGGRSFAPPRVLREFRDATNLDPVKDKDLMRQTNPIHHIANVRAPLLAAYGKNDPRVRFEQWQMLEARLKEHGKAYEAVIEEKEGHGFRKLETKLAFFRRVEDFLTRNMNVPEGRVKVGTPVTVPAKGE